MTSITSANAVIQIAVDVVFPTPQQLQGFTTDNIYDAPSYKPTEVQMGVDGHQSAGFIYSSKEVSYDLQADSLSNLFFDVWVQAMEAAEDVFTASGIILLKSVGTKFTMINGSLTGYTPIPSAGKLLKPRKHAITWERIIQAPSG
jgi:hypothetical protein